MTLKKSIGNTKSGETLKENLPTAEGMELSEEKLLDINGGHMTGITNAKLSPYSKNSLFNLKTKQP